MATDIDSKEFIEHVHSEALRAKELLIRAHISGDQLVIDKTQENILEHASFLGYPDIWLGTFNFDEEMREELLNRFVYEDDSREVDFNVCPFCNEVSPFCNCDAPEES